MFKVGVIGAAFATGALAEVTTIGDREITVLRMQCNSGLPAARFRQKCVDEAGNFLGCLDDGYHCIKKDIRSTYAGCYDSVPSSWSPVLSRLVVCEDEVLPGSTAATNQPAQEMTEVATAGSEPTATTTSVTPSGGNTIILGGRELSLLPMPCNPALPKAGIHERCFNPAGQFLGCVDGYHCFKKNIKNSLAGCYATLPAFPGWGSLLSRVVVCDDSIGLPVADDVTDEDDDEDADEDDDEDADEDDDEDADEDDFTAPEEPEPTTPDVVPITTPPAETSFDLNLPPIMPSKVHLDPNEGKRCLESDIFDTASGQQKCQCAGPLWRCADNKDTIAKACDVGTQCVRKNKFYAICAEVGGARYQELKETCEWDLTIIPCGEDTRTYAPEKLLPRGTCPPN